MGRAEAVLAKRLSDNFIFVQPQMMILIGVIWVWLHKTKVTRRGRLAKPALARSQKPVLVVKNCAWASAKAPFG